MSEANNARASRIMTNVSKGTYQQNNKFKGYGEIDVDRPSWDYRVQRHGKKLYFMDDRRKQNNGK
tara:strand:+ start:565 stop:759 length:195 start_codon:yes stop_codon:yes gene_type:complete